MVTKSFWLILILTFSSCSALVVLLSPAKQRGHGSIFIPKVNDYRFLKTKIKNDHFVELKTICYSTGMFNINSDFEGEEKIILFSDGHFIKTVFYREKMNVIDSSVSGFGGYYYRSNDTINVEYYGEYGTGHAYYYDKYLFKDSTLEFIEEKKQVRIPKKEKYQSRNWPNIDYPLLNIDSTTIINFMPYW